MRWFSAFGVLMLCLIAYAPAVNAQAVVEDEVSFMLARVEAVISSEEREIPGTGTPTTYQTIRVRLLDGLERGAMLTLDNDYLRLSQGDRLYVMRTVHTIDRSVTYAVSEPYRIPSLIWLGILFVLSTVLFGGLQGLRGLVALAISIFLISSLLLPGILAGYSPVLVSLGVSALIIVLGSYLTHGVTRTTSAAVLGMLTTIGVTSVIAYGAVYGSHLSGFTSDEATYLNFNTAGEIDLIGLLWGSLLIGLLGVLYDAAIGQAVAVEELASAAAHYSRMTLLRRGMRIGREHVGALVNTLAIAYVGAALPLLLLLTQVSRQGPLITINQEMFATELIRMMVGGIGVALAMPISTAVAVWMLYGRPSRASRASLHTH